MNYLLYGAGGHAKVIISCLLDANHTISGIFDDDRSRTSWNSIPVLNPYSSKFCQNDDLIISIGNNRIRKHISSLVSHQIGSIIHPSASVSTFACVGEGSVIFHHAVVQADCSLKKHTIVNTAAVIDHDCQLEDFVHVAPNATLCGGVRVGEGTLVGAGAIILPGIQIGRWVTIGAGTVVTKNIPDFGVIVGNPGQLIKYNPFL